MWHRELRDLAERGSAVSPHGENAAVPHGESAAELPRQCPHRESTAAPHGESAAALQCPHGESAAAPHGESAGRTARGECDLAARGEHGFTKVESISTVSHIIKNNSKFQTSRNESCESHYLYGKAIFLLRLLRTHKEIIKAFVEIVFHCPT